MTPSRGSSIKKRSEVSVLSVFCPFFLSLSPLFLHRTCLPPVEDLPVRYLVPPGEGVESRSVTQTTLQHHPTTASSGILLQSQHTAADMLHLRSPIYFAALLFLTLWYSACDGCEQDELVRGCRITQGRCFCGIGCDTEYPFSSREECRETLKGRRLDACSQNPCNNDGACIQTASSYANFKCKCEGTGFYGPRCQYRE
ncbi:hypothetical protein GE061_003906 [Apolygus lucorum]|uniref:EGF-like domain-containing protein n=1 Tax=Apolygus lucorum TaxID=248454 RepID=A0A8S9X1Q2_APOLU|nr:hypothetical protein GE061_003906 [Apolygus lucorum]